jgi:hypothetical protein
MDSDVRVCPHCGERPGAGVFCEACGRNLAAVEQLPTRAEWETARRVDGGADARPLEERCAEATSAFLAAMHAAGDPGAGKLPSSGGSGFRRPRRREGWVLRPVRHYDDEPTRYDAGLVLTTEGRFHRLGSEVRGWGQRDFPRYHETIGPEPIEMPVDERLIDELAALLAANDVAVEPGDGHDGA